MPVFIRLLRACRGGALLLFSVVCHQLSAQSGCFDSLKIVSSPAQCYSFRNGLIRIDSVYGGHPPYYFSIDNQTFSTRPEFDRLWAGTYQLSIRDGLGCTETRTVVVSEPAVLEVKLVSSRPSVARGEAFDLRATVTPTGVPIKQIEWRPPALFSRQDTLVQNGVRISQTTTFAIEIVDTNGCTARDQTTVEAEPPPLYFPNAIQVGSNQNAYFTVFAAEAVSEVSSLQIFGRDGSLVFERAHFQPNDPLLGWGGMANGRRVQPGVFAWTATIRYLDGAEERFSGTLTVLR